MPKRYRLLKDLPGCPKGTVFSYTGDGYMPLSTPIVVGAIASPYTGVLVSPVVEYNPDWFAPLSDDPPYPWEPTYYNDEELVDTWCAADPCGRRPKDWDDWHRLLKQGAIYRSRNDAELRLKVEPSTNAAVKALINEKAPYSPQAMHFHVYWSDLCLRYKVGGCTQTHRCITPDGPTYHAQQSANAIADHFNFILDPPDA